ncbi:lysine N(6)-hydroxylase/L-ornithine N(5)-oxygenase family protein [Bacillus shivajii]|uniref:FAD-dependent oxidoreductase n=1 Tax=Bacillus shivajii TaxID=1983719 RepID=UPI001CFA286D|nr:FAD/NAD(P)-binding protein [Bacillus shivajii]UCZ53425.1 lysine N(6)-hydroxylase/L-ornithine N(5)-oxygenase family protein [Bacillus shivajii]
MYDWIIIGGGVHGCTVANFLIQSGKTTTDKLKIIDPNPEPLYKWKRNTQLIGMEYLRSPSVHHIDMDPLGLEKYAKKTNEEKVFYGPYDRPSLHLFNEHCDITLDRINLQKSWLQGKVNHVSKEKGSWRVHTVNGEVIFGKNIVIAISVNNQLNIPGWVKSLHSGKLPIHHIYDENVSDLNTFSPPITVIGGGITAAHLTIKLSRLYPGKVTLLKRHPFRVESFDSDPGWLGPKFMSYFKGIKDFEKRRILINQARHKGSLPKDLYKKLIRLDKEKKINIIDGEVQGGSVINNKEIKLTLNDGYNIVSHTVLLATGFIPHRPNDEWLTNLIKQEQLQCAKCGYPIIQPSLEWCKHLYVSGPLSELEIGPVARNISGARKAAERIVRSIS